MMKIAPWDIMERVTLHLTLMYRMERLTDRMIVMRIMALWMRTLTLTNQRLYKNRMCSCQLDHWKSMILVNLVCWIVTEDDGKVSAK